MNLEEPEFQVLSEAGSLGKEYFEEMQKVLSYMYTAANVFVLIFVEAEKVFAVHVVPLS